MNYIPTGDSPIEDYEIGTAAYLVPVSALAAACPDCEAPAFEPCRREQVRIDELAGHVTVCGGRPKGANAG